MKRIVAIALALVFIFSLAACTGGGTGTDTAGTSSPGGGDSGASSPSGGDSGTSSPGGGDAADGPGYTEGLPWRIEKLPSKVKLEIGGLVAGPHVLPSYIAQQKGWLDEVGIEIEFHMFPNGPAMSEALGANVWDCGTLGIGGVITGIVGFDAIILGLSTNDQGTHRTFVRPDHPIALAGKGHLPGYPEVYGTADAWRGAEIMLPSGTTAHFIMAKTLEQFGLTMDDVNLVSMDVTSGNTAFKAGQGDVVSLWGNFIFTEDKDDFVVATGGREIDIETCGSLIANPVSLAGPKREAIVKWLEVYFMTVEWIIDNLEEATQYFVEHSEYEGIIANYDETLTLMRANGFHTMEANVEAFNLRVQDGRMSRQEEYIYKPLLFFVEQGNYEPFTLDKLLEGYFPPEYVMEAYENQMRARQ